MNEEYLKELFEETKDVFKDSELDILSVEDLKDLLIDYMVSNLQYDFDIDLDVDRLFEK